MTFFSFEHNFAVWNPENSQLVRFFLCQLETFQFFKGLASFPKFLYSYAFEITQHISQMEFQRWSCSEILLLRSQLYIFTNRYDLGHDVFLGIPLTWVDPFFCRWSAGQWFEDHVLLGNALFRGKLQSLLVEDMFLRDLEATFLWSVYVGSQ